MATGGGGKSLAVSSFVQAVVLGLVLASAPPVAQSWSKEGHMLTCQIAQVTTKHIGSSPRPFLAG